MKKIKQTLFLLLIACMLTGCDQQKQEFLFSAGAEVLDTAKQAEDAPGFRTENSGETLDTDDDDIKNASVSDAAGQTDKGTEDSEAVIYVDVCGAVISPGVYRLPAFSRVFEAISMAGGLTEEASAVSVNQAQPLTDGQQLYVPTLQEAQEMQDLREHSPAASSNSETPDRTDKVNINTADKQMLMTLNGIGETRAEAILSYREAHGAFQTAEDLLQVSGIKEGTLAKIRNRIVTG